MKRSYLATISGFIYRPRIDEIIEHGIGYPLVLAIAGPGYGKTLSVANYMKTADVRLVWLRIQHKRATAEEFWEDLVRAAESELPGYARQLKGLGFPESPGGFEQFRKMTATTAEAGKRLVVVLDNYERVSDEKIVEFINALIDSELNNFTLFILCNVKLPFVDARPSAGLFRISDKDFAFDLSEARKMFERYGHAVSDDIVERANKVAEGWALGLRLICEASPNSPEDYSSRTSVQMAADLHEQHYFKKYSRQIQTRLILFSLLPQFSLDMAEDSETDCPGLQELLIRHPFIHYDYGSGLFAFQSMYREFLLQKKSAVSLEARKKMQADAGRWFLENGMVIEAMDCYWESADYDSFLRAVSEMPKVNTKASFTNRILRRLEQIPRDYADKNPVVNFCIAFMYLNAANAERAKEMLLDLKNKIEERAESEENRLLLGDIYATLADISVFQNDDTGIFWIKKAYELIPGGSRTHSLGLRTIGNNSAFYIPCNASGELERMVGYFMEYAQYFDPVRNGCGYGFEYLFAGEAAYYTEEMDKAEILFNSAILKAQRTGQHDIICNALYNLARVELYYGNHKNAIELLTRIEEYIEENHAMDLHELRDCARALVYMKLDDLDKVPSWLAAILTGPEEMPVSIGRKQLTSAQYLYQSGETVKAYALILQLESLLEHKGRWYEKLCLYILKAQYHMALAEQDEFLRTFQKAYDMVRNNNMKVILSDYGKPMMSMIEKIRNTDAGTFDTDWLDEVYRDCVSYAKRQKMMRRAYGIELHGHPGSHPVLTARENETLHYLALGLTQPEIGKMMKISVNAVKKHVSKIYYKLGAVNRADAIHIASIDGLVDVINN